MTENLGTDLDFDLEVSQPVACGCIPAVNLAIPSDENETTEVAPAPTESYSDAVDDDDMEASPFSSATYTEGNDAAENASTPYVISAGDTFNGTISNNEDEDWIGLNVVSGQTYVISLDGVSLSDPYLRLYNSNGTLIASNDDGGLGLNSEITFTATSSGRYYIEADAYLSATGTYQLTTSVSSNDPLPVFTNDQIAEQLNEGYWGTGQTRGWNVEAGEVILVDIDRLNAAGQQLATLALEMWSEFTGIQFQFGNYSSGSILNATETAANFTNNVIVFDDDYSGAFATSSYNQTPTSYGAEDTITASVINVSSSWLTTYGTEIDDYSFTTYIHEIGHALGLGHAGNYNGNASYGTTEGAGDNHYLNDSRQATIMSYFGQGENSYINASDANPMSLMIADILALQDLYGTTTSLRAGNTTYGQGSNAGSFFDQMFDVISTGTFTILDDGGIDTIDVSNLTTNNTVDLNDESISSIGGLTGNVSIARGTFIENFTSGSGNDTIVGNEFANSLRGNGGNDTLSGGGGNDYLYGGSGNNEISLGAGNDYVSVGGGQETFYGGSGNDYISYYGSGGITANLATNTISGSWASNDTISSFESITGSGTGADNITGTSGANTIRTYGGNDFVYAGNGADYVSLGEGDDYVSAGGGQETFYGGTGNDYISYYNSTGGVSLNLQANTASGSWAGNDIVNGFESVTGSGTGADNITGTSGANTIRTYGGNDFVYAGNGADYVSLGEGDDYVSAGGGQETFYGGTGNDYISYYNSTGGVSLNLQANTASGSWAGNDIVNGFESVTGSGTGADNITGTSGANTIRTYGGNDFVYAGNGADYVSLGEGDDYVSAGGGQETFYGGTGNDYISYYNSTGGVSLNLQANTASGSWAGNDIVNGFESVTGSGTGADNITGTSGANTIRTYGGNDYVYAGNGADYVSLGEGDDYVSVGGGQETFYGGAGNDYISYYNSTGGVTIDLQANTASGSWAGNDIVNGFESVTGSAVGADTILGTSGANTIRTSGGNDELDGRAGNDILYGGSGSDTFHFDLGGDADVIMDFQNNVDTIEFENFNFGSQDPFAYASQVGSDVVFNFGGGDILTVENVTIDQLQNDVIF